MQAMKTITLRKLPPELEEKVEARSRELGLSLNKTVIRLLEERLIPSSSALGGRRHTDLDHLSGSWSDEEADEFDESLDQQRQIEPELWR